MDLPLARPSLYAPATLRRSVCGETMSTPGAPGTRYSYHSLRARCTGLYHRVGALWATWLRPFALPRSYPLGPLLNNPVFAAHNTPRYEQSLAGFPGRSGRGYGPLSRRIQRPAYEICLASPLRW